MGMSHDVESVPPETSKILDEIVLEYGCGYLVREAKPEVSYKLFRHLLEEGVPGLCISRQYPDRVRQRLGGMEARVLWLSHTPGDSHHNPTALSALAKIVCKFIEDHPRSAILLDGLEYLVINNGFLQALTCLEHINEFVMPRKALALVPVSPEAFKERELALLERNLEVIEYPLLRGTFDREIVNRLIDNY